MVDNHKKVCKVQCFDLSETWETQDCLNVNYKNLRCMTIYRKFFPPQIKDKEEAAALISYGLLKKYDNAN